MTYPTPQERSFLYSTLIMEMSPIEERFCPDCRNAWHDCGCDLPTYQEVANEPLCQQKVPAR